MAPSGEALILTRFNWLSGIRRAEGPITQTFSAEELFEQRKRRLKTSVLRALAVEADEIGSSRFCRMAFKGWERGWDFSNPWVRTHNACPK
jgi:hypothetical protein